MGGGCFVVVVVGFVVVVVGVVVVVVDVVVGVVVVVVGVVVVVVDVVVGVVDVVVGVVVVVVDVVVVVRAKWRTHRKARAQEAPAYHTKRAAGEAKAAAACAHCLSRGGKRRRRANRTPSAARRFLI
uniref:Uncharacterized protein n=1 Tax=Globodera pallida TaxID=36090 RepID=A0A183BX59_GLOPA